MQSKKLNNTKMYRKELTFDGDEDENTFLVEWKRKMCNDAMWM